MKNKPYFIFVFLLAILPLSAVVVPRFLAFGPSIIGVLFFILHRVMTGSWPALPRSALIFLGAVSAMAFASCLWAIDSGDAVGRVARTAAVLGSGVFLLAYCHAVDIERLRPYLWVLPVSVLLTAVLIFFERSLDGPLYRLVRGAEGAALQSVPSAVFNRPMVVFSLCVFPAMAMLRRYIASVSLRALVLCSGILPAFFITQSQSSQLALILGFLVMAAFPYARAGAWRAYAFFVAVMMFAAPFIVGWIFRNYAADLQSMSVIGIGGGYAGNRLEIWDFVFRYALQKPVLGYGFEAARYITDFDTRQIFQEGTTVLHPHNFDIQLWLEFGAVGVAGAAALFAWLLEDIRKRFTVAQCRIILPVITACLSIGATGYGMWQGWWLGLLFLAAVFSILAARLEPQEPKNLV